MHFYVVSSACLAGARANVVECTFVRGAILTARTFTTPRVVTAERRTIEDICTLTKTCLEFGLINDNPHGATETQLDAIWLVSLEHNLVVVQRRRHSAISFTFVALSSHEWRAEQVLIKIIEIVEHRDGDTKGRVVVIFIESHVTRIEQRCSLLGSAFSRCW